VPFNRGADYEWRVMMLALSTPAVTPSLNQPETQDTRDDQEDRYNVIQQLWHD
jgi:hypothetical protein